jgi:hypothetical protein
VAEVLEALGLSKSTFYKYAAQLAIKLQTHWGKAWLAGAEVELLNTYARHCSACLSAAQALTAVGRGTLVAIASPAPLLHLVLRVQLQHDVHLRGDVGPVDLWFGRSGTLADYFLAVGEALPNGLCGLRLRLSC